MRTLIGVVAALGFIIAASACDTPIRPSDSTVYTLSGHVTDTSHNAVANITVGLRTDKNDSLTAISDFGGQYIFPGITSAGLLPHVSVYVQAANYGLYSKVVDLKPNVVTTLDIVLNRQ